jgi:hypothetical protein
VADRRPAVDRLDRQLVLDLESGQETGTARTASAIGHTTAVEESGDSP